MFIPRGGLCALPNQPNKTFRLDPSGFSDSCLMNYSAAGAFKLLDEF